MADNLDSLRCALSYDAHFIQCPIPLTCGHAVCKKCIPIILDENSNIIKKTIVCDICGQENKSDLSVVQESIVIKNLLDMNFGKFLEGICSNFEESLSKLKSKRKVKFCYYYYIFFNHFY